MYASHASNGPQDTGNEKKGDGITHEPRLPSHTPPPMHLQLELDVLPLLEVDHAGQLEQMSLLL